MFFAKGAESPMFFLDFLKPLIPCFNDGNPGLDVFEGVKSSFEIIHTYICMFLFCKKQYFLCLKKLFAFLELK